MAQIESREVMLRQSESRDIYEEPKLKPQIPTIYEERDAETNYPPSSDTATNRTSPSRRNNYTHIWQGAQLPVTSADVTDPVSNREIIFGDVSQGNAERMGNGLIPTSKHR